MLSTETRGRSSERGSCSKNRSKYEKCRSKSRSSQQEVECWNCGKMGHYRRNYKELRKQNDSANVVAGQNQDVLLLLVDSLIDSWVLDSGASFHTTAHWEIIENYVPTNFRKVYLIEGEALEIVGMGHV